MRFRAHCGYTCILLDLAGILVFSFSNNALGGIIPFSRIMMHLRMLASPLAPSVWPKLAFNEPLDALLELNFV